MLLLRPVWLQLYLTRGNITCRHLLITAVFIVGTVSSLPSVEVPYNFASPYTHQLLTLDIASSSDTS